MTHLILAALLIFSINAIASTKAPSEAKPFQLPDFSKIHSPAADSKVQFAITCKQLDGQEINSDHPQYETCLHNAQRSSQNGANPSQGFNQPEAKGSINFKIAD